MKSEPRLMKIILLCLFIVVIFSGFVHAENDAAKETSQNGISIESFVSNFIPQANETITIKANITDSEAVDRVYARIKDKLFDLNLISGTTYDGQWQLDWTSDTDEIEGIQVYLTVLHADGTGKTKVMVPDSFLEQSESKPASSGYFKNLEAEEIFGIILLAFIIIYFGMNYFRKRPLLNIKAKSSVFLIGFTLSLAYLIYTTATGIIYHEPVLYCNCAGNSFLPALYHLTLCTIPFFFVGCGIAGLLMKWFSSSRKKEGILSSMPVFAVFASLLPICSCSTPPIIAGLLKNIKFRAVLAFLVVTPILNPMVITMSFGIIGKEYAILRIISVLALAFLIGILGERLFRNSQGDLSKVVCKGSCFVCPINKGFISTSTTLFISLLRYIFAGILVGAILQSYISIDILKNFIQSGSGIVGLLVAVTIGLPLFICAGQDIIILKPLLGAGLPLGHAIAFSITGNAICIIGIAALLGVFNKKIVAYLIASFWLGAVALGLLINYSIFWSIALLGLFVIVVTAWELGIYKINKIRKYLFLR